MEEVLQTMMVRSMRDCAGVRIQELRELLQGLHDLAGALAAGRDDHDVHVRVAAGDLLEHRLAGAEGAGDAVGSALGHGEEGVDQPHVGDHGLHGLEALGVAVDRALDRPLEHQGHGMDRPVLALEFRHLVGDLVGSGGVMDFTV